MKKTLSAFLILFVLALSMLPESLSANQMGGDEPIDISLKDADLRQTLHSFAAISGMDLDASSDLKGLVTVNIEGQPWPAVLDQLCRDHDLSCEKINGTPPILRVRSADPGGDYPLVEGFATSMSLSLKEADLRELLKSFGSIAEVAVDIDDEVQGSVSLSIVGAPWTVVLVEVCRLAGCQVEWGQDFLRIKQAPGGEVDTLAMSLKDADLRATLESFSGLPILGPEGVTVEVEPSLSGSVTVELNQVNWQQALDLICADAGCAWGLKYGTPSILHISAAEQSDPVLAAVGEPGAPAKRLGYRLTLPGEGPQSGTAELTWADPIQQLGSAGAYWARLSWIPFGPKLSVVLPSIEHCDGKLSSISLLDPVILPLTETVRHKAEGVVLELFPPEEDATPQIAEKLAQACGADGSAKVAVTVRRQAKVGDDRPRPTQVQSGGGYLLVRPVEARQPVAAVISLGTDLDGRQNLALLRASDDRKELVLETLSLAAGEHTVKVVRSEDYPYELRIEYEETH